MLQKSTNQPGLMTTLWLPPGYILFGLHLRIINEPNTVSHMKTSSSKAAISMIKEKPENEILLLQKFCHVFIVVALYLNKVS